MIWFAIIEVSFVVWRKPWVAPFLLGVGGLSLALLDVGVLAGWLKIPHPHPLTFNL